MSDFPDNFEMKPTDKATIELRYAEPKTGVVSKGRNEGNTWILYQVQVNNDGEWRGWFTSPDSTAYNAHKMIQKRGYKPGISIDIELTAESRWIIRGETYETVFGLPELEKNAGPSEHGSLEALESRTKAAFGIVGERLKQIEADIDRLAKPPEKQIDPEDVPF